MKTKQIKIGSKAWKTMQNFVATTLFVTMLIACSKGDDSVGPIDESTGTTENTGGTSQGIGVTVLIKSMEPESPAILKFGDSIAVTYDYDITRPDGARIWIEPFSNDAISPSNKYSPSPVYKGKGTETVYFSVTQGDTIVVDQVKIQMNKAGLVLLGVLIGAEPLKESFEEVEYTFTN